MKRTSMLVAAGIIFTAQTISLNTVTASTITVDFEADLSAIPFDLLGAGFTNTNPLTGGFSFDDTTTDSDGTVIFGDYFGALTSLSFSDTGASVTGSASNGDIRIVDSGTDSFVVSVGLGDGLTGSSGGATGYTLDSFSFNLADSTGSVFASDALPTTLALTDFSFIHSITLAYRASDGVTVNNAVYDITSLTTSTGTGPGTGNAPEPPTLALLGIALLGMGYVRRKQIASRS